MAKLPNPPDVHELRRHSPAVHTVSTTDVLWRIHNTTGDHVTAWNALRHYGPVASCRFDTDPPPVGEHPDTGVLYTATDVPTALAECYQQTRIINTHRRNPYLTGFTLTRDAVLLDLTGAWPIRIGASHTINTGPTDRTRTWTRALLAAWPNTDGLLSTSALTGQPCITLLTPATDALPHTPAFSEPLNHPGLAAPLATAAHHISYRIL